MQKTFQWMIWRNRLIAACQDARIVYGLNMQKD